MHKISICKKCLLVLWTILLFVSLAGCQSTSIKGPAERPSPNTAISKEDTAANRVQKDQAANTTGIIRIQVIKGESYSTRDEVASYIFEFHTLPPNYITKTEAQKLGWDNSKGNLWKVTNRKSIGGDRFGNLEGRLPKANGRQYYECDIDYSGGYRSAKRIIYSNDGLVFYTDDHYNTFKQLYWGDSR
ncbi:MAG: ribonuclease [Firmicutes bacterium]|nr:ribonuclease [Bacillota bacterium]